MTIFTFMRTLCKRKVTSTTIQHESNVIEENIESSLANAPNDTAMNDDTKDRFKRLSWRSTSGSQGISSPSQLLPPTPFNTPKKKKLRRSIRDHILGDNGTVVFVNEILPSSPTPDCPPSNIATGTLNLPPIYAAHMGLQSPSPANQGLEIGTSSAGGASSVNPGHEALNVLNQLSRVSNSLPTSGSLFSRSAELRSHAVCDQSQSDRAASATTFRTIGFIPVLSCSEYDNPPRGNCDRSAGQFEVQDSPTPPSSPTLPTSQSPATIQPRIAKRNIYVDDILHDETVDERRHQAVIYLDAAGGEKAGAYARAHLDVYDRLWLDAERRKHHEIYVEKFLDPSEVHASVLNYRLLGLTTWDVASFGRKDPDPQPTVTISNGIVIGTATGVLNQPSVTGLANAYLGIPFAQSPPTRFSPPVASDPWSEPLLAQTLPNTCIQQLSPGTGTHVGGESEDCLYLNVFAPRNASPENLKPVLFWLYGGNLILGSISDARYNGSSLAVNEDVVVVAANYRTNLSGFSNSPEIPAGLRNSGFLDQRFALQWVQENIDAFGGDASRVTIFGESAGGYSVKQLLANPPTPLPYHGAILQSQASNNIGDGVQSWNEVVNHFGCNSSSSSLDCLRQVPATELQAYITEENLQFPPDEDNATHTNNALPNISSGKFAPVPILIGTNRDEGRLYTGSVGVDNVDVLNRSSVVGWIQGYVMVDISTIIDEIYLTYSEAILSDAFLLVSQIQTDLLFNCPAKALSEALVSARRRLWRESHVWRYRYDAEFPNLEIFPRAGVYHSSEIPIVFGTYPEENATTQQTQLSAELQAIWAGMGRNPSAGPGRTEVSDDEKEKDLAIIGVEANATGLYLTDRRENDAACKVFRPLLEKLRKLY
ncbi:hypothetical protein CBER1_10650 [Cercospora berteroae]|uniref:Carboxylesterase type B domain-containing protein n=1 Tax=Cercospora berteroae TaxID=357750 RepID=A0A2S6BXV8_9PEZI|nr:hypothetical protein CBER1_10650 [Cercospora berteroae]